MLKKWLGKIACRLRLHNQVHIAWAESPGTLFKEPVWKCNRKGCSYRAVGWR